jgi:hypothetical protein
MLKSKILEDCRLGITHRLNISDVSLTLYILLQKTEGCPVLKDNPQVEHFIFFPLKTLYQASLNLQKTKFD